MVFTSRVVREHLSYFIACASYPFDFEGLFPKDNPFIEHIDCFNSLSLCIVLLSRSHHSFDRQELSLG